MTAIDEDEDRKEEEENQLDNFGFEDPINNHDDKFWRKDLTSEQKAARKKALEDLAWKKAEKWDFSKEKFRSEVESEAEEKKRKKDADKQSLSDLVELLFNEYHFKTTTDNEEIWYYDASTGTYKKDGEIIIKGTLQALIPEDLTIHLTNEMIARVQRSTYFDRKELNSQIQWIATKNCMVNLATGESRPFSHKFLCSTSVPILYRKEKKGCLQNFKPSVITQSRIMKFLYEIMNESDVNLFLDFLAYSFWREYRYNFWMILDGAGQNGKSILLQLMERFLGNENVSGETLDRLLHERFAVAQLYGKMLNVDADVSADVVFNNTGIIKKLTGNDLHTGEFKYKKPFPFRNHAKLIFSCNKTPQTQDMTTAFFRRLLMISFTHQFLGEKDDPHIIDKICTEEEFSFLFSEVLSRMPRIIKEGVRKVTEQGIEETYDKFMRRSDSILYFYNRAISIIPGAKVKKKDLYEHYLKLCAQYGISPESDTLLSRKLTDDQGLKSTRTRVKGEQAYWWIDIELKDWNEEERQKEKATLEALVEGKYFEEGVLDDYR